MSLNLEIPMPADSATRLAFPQTIRQWVTLYLRRAADLVGVAEGRWTLYLVNDKRMIRYHRQYLNIATTTDVLTFNYTDENKNAPLHLETIICMDEARRQARERGHQMEYELLLYAVHSLLHCFGYDDRNRSEALRMHQQEDAILHQMGFPPIYFSGADAQVKTKRTRAVKRKIKKVGAPTGPERLRGESR